MRKPKLLIFGGSGKLGSELFNLASSDFDVFKPSHSECDITDQEQVMTTFAAIKPDIVINTVAITGAHECDRNKEKAWLVNVEGAANVARACKEFGARIVFLSSAAIFDGKKGVYSEKDAPNPSYYYATTKAAAEQTIFEAKNHAIIRLDFFPINGLKYTQVFSDHFTSKIPVKTAAMKTLQIARSSFVGIINIGQQRKSLYEILKPYYPDIVPIRVSESSLPDFPKDISLDLSLWEVQFPES